MMSYNRLIADELNKNVERYIQSTAQPYALSTGHLYGGKRVRDHPQQGFTAYSQDPSTLIPSNSLMMSPSIYDTDDTLEGSGISGGKYSVNKFVRDFNKIGKLIKPVAKPIVRALTKKAVSKIEGAGMSGGAELYPPTVARGGRRGSTARGELIKKVMREHGLKLGQASKFIKEHGLF